MKNSGKKRPLSAAEIILARKVFGDTINYKSVRIANRRILPFAQPKHGGMCTGNTINITGSAYCEDYSAKMRSFFIHEMTHIWQYQKNPAYIGKKYLAELRKHHFNYMSKAYVYTIEDGKPFDDYGLEQQASMVEDYFALTFNNGRGETRRCQNKGLVGEYKRQALEKILAPHFPLSKTLGKAPRKAYKPR